MTNQITTTPQKPAALEWNRPNETIGLVASKGRRITAAQRKLYAAILLFSQNQPNVTVFRAFLKDLLEVAGISGTNRNEIKGMLQSLRDTSAWFRFGDKEPLIGMLDRPNFVDGRGSLTILEWELDEFIRERVINPVGYYTRLHLENITKLRLGASIALYEICSSYATFKQKDNVGTTGLKPLSQWVSMILGSKKDYEYAIFKRDILKPAIAEINAESNITVELKEKKSGRSVTDLEFNIIKKYAETALSEAEENRSVEIKKLADVKQFTSDPEKNRKVTLTESSDEDLPEIDLEIYHLLGNAKVSKRTIQKILSNYQDKEYIKRHAEQMQNKVQHGYEIKAPDAYINTALKNDFHDQSRNVGPTHASHVAAVITKSEDKKNSTNLIKLYEEKFVSLDATEQAAILKEWISDQTVSPVIKGVYRQSGIQRIDIKMAFLAWYERMYAHSTS